MKILLIIGGALFLLLSFALIAGAVVMFFMARNRRARAVEAAPPAQSFSTNPVASEPDPLATMVVDMRPAAPQFGALHGVSGPVAGGVFPIDARGFYIGRDRTVSQVIVDSAGVSKRHVWVGVKDGSVVAIDQGSTNGTFLNSLGSGITEVRLEPGDTLILADDAARLTYRT